MIRTILSFLLLTGLASCASISYPLPKCDGYARRPLNRAMWQWEDKSPTRQPTSAATPYAEIQNQAAPAAFEQFDIAGSYRNCGKE
ncbi:hypothetical protein [Sinorhizobium alkalisoli]|uniref:Type IV secretion system protein VirB7 n=1 Tax=Sinorhizobium alkalisoli TaxID=1752398 RepID=A0A1E3V7M6_9HYPH|nr:hypothetical protein [Sinorhizobium alkalisoli]ODR88826.1 hypothetical protein A8M32_23830 [Sinorhizobium alkalisoli]